MEDKSTADLTPFLTPFFTYNGLRVSGFAIAPPKFLPLAKTSDTRLLSDV